MLVGSSKYPRHLSWWDVGGSEYPVESVEVCVSWLGHHGCKKIIGAFPGFAYSSVVLSLWLFFP